MISKNNNSLFPVGGIAIIMVILAAILIFGTGKAGSSVKDKEDTGYSAEETEVSEGSDTPADLSALPAEAPQEEVNLKASEETLSRAGEIKEPESSEAEAEEAEAERSEADKKVDEIINRMTQEDKICQLFIVTPEQLTKVGGVTEAGETTRECLDKYPVGGIVYFSNNLQNKEQIREMLENTQKYALDREGVPLFLCVDEEGGKVSRIAGNPGFGIEKIKDMSDVESEEEAFDIGAEIGEYLSELGFNLDFAPDADVLTNPDNDIIGKRSFGKDPERVSSFAAAYSRGLQSKGILSTFKHFPGHGATAGDTHKGFAYTDKTLEELKKNELVPFASAGKENVDLIMVSHISVPEILGDDTPCSLSHRMTTDILKNEMGYDGLIITDAMNMGAIIDSYDSSKAVIMAINAGADLILMPQDLESALQAVSDAVRSGEIEEETIDASVRKIIAAKLS